jgi:hypothetical protein
MAGMSLSPAGEKHRYGDDIDDCNLDALDDSRPVPRHRPNIQVGIEEEDHQAHEIAGMHNEIGP